MRRQDEQLEGSWRESFSRSAYATAVDRSEVDFAAERVLQMLRKYHAVDPVHSMRIYEIKRLANNLPVYDRREPPSPVTTYIVQTLTDLLNVPPEQDPSHFAHFRQQFAYRLGLSHQTYKPLLPKELNNVLHHTLSELLSDMHEQRPYIPRSSDDVFQTEKLLHTSLGLPLTIVWDILEHAEYWVRSVGSGGKGVGWYIPLNPRNPMGVTVITRIPETVKGYRPVRRVIFTIAAYESGPMLDTDVGPQTWFEAEANHDPHTRQLIVCNESASAVPHMHRVQWDCSPLDDRAAGVGLALREWLGTLEPGDTLSMVPVTANPERRNWVGLVTVEVYCACV